MTEEKFLICKTPLSSFIDPKNFAKQWFRDFSALEIQITWSFRRIRFRNKFAGPKQYSRQWHNTEICNLLHHSSDQGLFVSKEAECTGCYSQGVWVCVNCMCGTFHFRICYETMKPMRLTSITCWWSADPARLMAWWKNIWGLTCWAVLPAAPEISKAPSPGATHHFRHDFLF